MNRDELREREDGTTTHYRAKSGERAWLYLVAIGIGVFGFAVLASDGFGLFASPGEETDVAVVETPAPTDAAAAEPTPEPTPTPASRFTSASTESVPPPALDPDIKTIAAESGCELSRLSVPADTALREWSHYWYTSESRSGEEAMFVAGIAGQHTPVWYAGVGPQLITVGPVPVETELTGRNLDDDRAIAPADLNVPGNIPVEPLTAGSVDFPTSGCWELAIGDGRIIVYVLPAIDNPEVERVANERAELLPTDPPHACEVTSWGGPTIRSGLPVGYWIDGADLSAWHRYGILFEGENLLFLVPNRFPEGRTAASVAGVHQETPTLNVVASLQQRAGGVSQRYWSVEINFPESGCWDLTFSAGDNELSATVYVYPGERSS